MDDTICKQILDKLTSIETRLVALENVFSSYSDTYEETLSQEELDSLFQQAIEIIKQYDRASASLLQRRLSIGYARAARLIDQLEAKGYVSKSEGSKPRTVLIDKN